MKKYLTLVASLTLLSAPRSGSAQSVVPTTIHLHASGTQPSIEITWPTVPGKSYDVLTLTNLHQPWMTNPAPVKATTTISRITNVPTAPAGFYAVTEQPTPPGNTGTISLATVTELEKSLDLTFTAAQRSQLINALPSLRTEYETARKIHLSNGDPQCLTFDPRPTGFILDSIQQPISWSLPQNTLRPTNLADLAFFSVRDLGEMIRSRQITSVELTSLSLARLKKYDPQLHCVITLTEDLAMRQAARADQEIAMGQYRGPLHGIPYGIKDLFSARGYRTTWGASPFRDQVIDEDAAVVQRLERAGAVLVAKLAAGELAVNDIWFGGQTSNPWNTSQGSGGSSAGPGAATSAGLVPFAIGTETWGSIIEPCTRCRVTGLRSTYGRISRTGAMTLSYSMDKVGPICRYVEDCAIVFDAIRGSDGIDRSVVDVPFNYNSSLDLTKLRVGYRSAYLNPTILNRLSAIVGQAHLVNFSLPANPVDPLLVIDAEAASAFDELFRFGADALLIQDTWRQELPKGRTIPAVEYLQANRLRRKLIDDMAGAMQDIDVFVTTDADALGGPTLDVTNLSGQPCVVIPHGGGTSLSFVGKPFAEATILSLAKAYQDATSFHTNRPPGFVQ